MVKTSYSVVERIELESLMYKLVKFQYSFVMVNEKIFNLATMMVPHNLPNTKFLLL